MILSIICFIIGIATGAGLLLAYQRATPAADDFSFDCNDDSEHA